MDELVRAVGDRIRAGMAPGMTQRDLADRVGMAPDALSRALNGQRGFSLPELAKIGKELGSNLHWLITGNDDPHLVNVAARHGWDPKRRTRTNPGKTADEPVLAKIAVAYRETYPETLPSSRALPAHAESLGQLLGEQFVRRFAGVVEERLDVDVIRLPGISTDYSLTIGGRGIIVLSSSQHWFRSNWSLAHELAHLALAHHDGFDSMATQQEPVADRFAAQLLLPQARVTAVDWAGMDEAGVARFIWTAGVSTAALANRLTDLGITITDRVAAALDLSTPRLLRTHVATRATGITADAIAERQQESASRRFPLGLVADLTRRVEEGDADPEALAWVLDVPIDDIDFPEPDEDAEAAAYEQMLADRAAPADLEDWLGRASQAS